jgi:hypothetical protein
LAIFLKSARRALVASSAHDGDADEQLATAGLFSVLTQEVRNTYLPLLAEPGGAITPPEIRQAASNLVREVFPEFSMILAPTAEFPEILHIRNLGRALKELHPRWPDDTEPRFPEFAEHPLIVLRYPELKARNPVYFSLVFGHEVMHLIADSIFEALIPLVSLNDEDFKKLVTELSSTPLIPTTTAPLVGTAFTEAQLHQAITARWGNLRENWLREITCDLLATRLLGPCFTYAMTQLALQSGMLDHYSETHPPFRLRLHLILAELRSLGFRTSASSKQGPAADYLEFVTKIVAQPKTSQPDTMQAIAERLIRRHAAQLHERVREVPWPIPYQWSQFRKTARSLRALLQVGAPPIDPSSETLLADILNSAFAFEVSELDKIYEILQVEERDQTLEGYERFLDLVLKGIEASQVTEVWANVKASIEAESH